MTKPSIAVWFRKGLRLHDNLALVKAAEEGSSVLPFFILDPWFVKNAKVGSNRWRFLLESLQDLDDNLKKKYNCRLYVFKGSPEEILISQIFKACQSVYYEYDSEPYALERDGNVKKWGEKENVIIKSFNGHTILDLEKLGGTALKPPTTMKDIEKICLQNIPGSTPAKLNVPLPVDAPKSMPSAPLKFEADKHGVPALKDIINNNDKTTANSKKYFPGGETEALKRLQKRVSSQPQFVSTFQKPSTMSTNSEDDVYEPFTTGLSPYMKFGCLSVRKFWHAVQNVMPKDGSGSKPPQSLHGQLLFREQFYLLGKLVPNYDKGVNNSMCKVIDWDDPATGNEEAKQKLEAWRNGQTGYPFIDALMRQLNETGWMHHLGRHACACFLTRGDLYVHWTAGRDVFDELLLDADWSLNNSNWLWLAGVAPFSAPYFRVYSPVPGPKASVNAEQKTGNFIRTFVPELKNMPLKYIYKPWEAPANIQQQAKCVVGKDYPARIVIHEDVKDANIARFKQALDRFKDCGPAPGKGVTDKLDLDQQTANKGKGKGKNKGGGKKTTTKSPRETRPAPKSIASYFAGSNVEEDGSTNDAKSPERKKSRWKKD